MMAPLRVLVVEDDSSMLDYLCALLTGWGFVAEQARSATDALDALQRDCPDVVISDLLMPGMDGLDLLRAIRAIKDCVVFFILLTAYGTVSVAVEAITDGADEVLTKPLDEEALCVMLQRVEDAKRKRAKV